MTTMSSTLLHPLTRAGATPSRASKRRNAYRRTVAASWLPSSKRVSYLRDIALFTNCSNGELAQIASLTTEIEVSAGRVLMEQGDLGLEFFVIIEGEAAVIQNGRHLATRGAGSFVGEQAVINRGFRNATVVAETDMRLLVQSRREFSSLDHAAPSVVRTIVAEAGRRHLQSILSNRGAGVRAAV